MSRRFRALNRKAHLVDDGYGVQVHGLAFGECAAVFAPGWEVGQLGDPDPCPWKHDLDLCWSTCYWTGQVPDMFNYPEWLGACDNINLDWRNLCTIPDH